MPYSPPEPRWDIVEEHLDEAEFLWAMWEHSLLSPKYTLDTVARGAPLVLLEAMKMELRLTAPQDGQVSKIYCAPGQVVERGQRLVEIQ